MDAERDGEWPVTPGFSRRLVNYLGFDLVHIIFRLTSKRASGSLALAIRP
jgi:hypothetical protein